MSNSTRPSILCKVEAEGLGVMAYIRSLSFQSAPATPATPATPFATGTPRSEDDHVPGNEEYSDAWSDVEPDSDEETDLEVLIKETDLEVLIKLLGSDDLLCEFEPCATDTACAMDTD